MIEKGGKIVLKDLTQNIEMELKCEISDRQRALLLAGGLLNYTRDQAE